MQSNALWEKNILVFEYSLEKVEKKIEEKEDIKIEENDAKIESEKIENNIDGNDKNENN